jgi:hypothetical protein
LRCGLGLGRQDFTVLYDLSHLTQDASQAVAGPIQDDEALLLYSVCRVTCAARIAEFGGQSGYSARNFVAAIQELPGAALYTIDMSPVPIVAPCHRFVHKPARAVVPADFDGKPLDLVFFDCHDFHEQMHAFETLAAAGVITRSTMIALHDTGTHPEQFVPWAYAGPGGWIHQPVERAMSDRFQDQGYECVHFHAPRPTGAIRFRHGLTLCMPRRRLPIDRLA